MVRFRKAKNQTFEYIQTKKVEKLDEIYRQDGEEIQDVVENIKEAETQVVAQIAVTIAKRNFQKMAWFMFSQKNCKRFCPREIGKS